MEADDVAVGIVDFGTAHPDELHHADAVALVPSSLPSTHVAASVTRKAVRGRSAAGFHPGIFPERVGLWVADSSRVMQTLYGFSVY